jgi:formamidopyrimidine-DNA glycosylase
MPELPEVETIRQDLRQKILRTSIQTVEVRRAKIVKGKSKAFIAELEGASFVEIDRIGKLLLFRLSTGAHMAVHLKMTGQLLYRFGDTLIAGGHTFPPVHEHLPNKHTHVIITFTNGSVLFFNDMRLFGYMSLLSDDEREKIWKTYGPEPEDKVFTAEYLLQIIKRRTISLKAVLLNQELVAGIGNIYADETCFLAGVRPQRKASSITKKEATRIVEAARQVIALAIKERGTTFNDYRDPEGRKGNFVQFLKVYGRGGEPCAVCGRALIKTVVAGRGTVYCGTCQK